MPDALDTPTTSTRSAYERIGIVLHELIPRHPRLGLTFGYIGNLERWGDDRGWKVFTACSRPSGYATSVNWGDYPTSHLDQMADAAEQHLAGWCEKIEAEIDKGKVLADPKTRTKP